MPLIVTDARAATLFWPICVAYILLERRVARRDRDPRAAGDDLDGGTRRFLGRCLLATVSIALAAALTLDGLRLPGDPWIWLLIGAGLMWTGIALRQWAISTLGRLFRGIVTVQEGHRVVTAGPYRFVRHPSYTGALLTFAGFGLGLGNTVSAAACLVLPMISYLRRIAVEEEVLSERLGPPYVDYARSTPRVIPGRRTERGGTGVPPGDPGALTGGSVRQ